MKIYDMLLFLWVAVYIKFVISFNIDTNKPLFFNGDSGSSFGYSVQMTETEHDKWLLVGAPKTRRADTTLKGVIYKCQINFQRNISKYCQHIDADGADDNIATAYLGSSMEVVDDTIVVCASTIQQSSCFTPNIIENRLVYVSNTRRSNREWKNTSAGFSISNHKYDDYVAFGTPSIDHSKDLLETLQWMSGWLVLKEGITWYNTWLIKKLIDGVLSYGHYQRRHRVVVYKGRQRQNVVNYPNGLGYHTVTQLVEPHFGKHHHVTFDSYFSSPRLCHDLLDQNTYSTGTVCVRRRGMPRSYRKLSLPKGETKVMSQGDLIAVHWSDRRPVNFLSTFSLPRIQNSNNSRGQEVRTPLVVQCYNRTMGGVDLGDQMISEYIPDIRSVKMWKKVLFNLITTATGGFLLSNTEEESKIHKMSDILDQVTQKSAVFAGYSITTGAFPPRHACERPIIVGAPRFRTYIGVAGGAFLICSNGTKFLLKKQLTGDKANGGFGSVVLFDDVTGDGVNDLIVGAPLENNDAGTVYVYKGTDQNSILVPMYPRLNCKETGRFGSAIQVIGDINKDSYNDIAVGAPYYDDMKGSVFIYHGGPIRLSLQQTIKAADLNYNLRAFGWSIASPLDVDDNNYPDLAVGAYLSDKVTVFRTKPIIDLFCHVDVVPEVIPLNSSGLECQDENYSPCVTINVCFNYTGISVPENIFVHWNVSADKKRTNAIPKLSSRFNVFSDGVTFNDTFTQDSIRVGKGQHYCMKIFAVVPSVNRQFLAALGVDVQFETYFGLSTAQRYGELTPILNNKPTNIISTVKFKSDCTDTCKPDLVLNIDTKPGVITFGETSVILVKLEVLNINEVAHDTRIVIRSSSNTAFLGFYQPPESDIIGECKHIQQSAEVNKTVCKVEKSLYPQQKVLFDLRYNVSMDKLKGETDDVYNVTRMVVFVANVDSANTDIDQSNNNKQLNVLVVFSSRLQLSGISNPEQFRLSEQSQFELTHSYSLYNHGPSPLSVGTVRVCLPFTADLMQITSDHDRTIVMNNPHPTINDSRPESFLENQTAIKERQIKEPQPKELSCDIHPNNNKLYDVSVERLGKAETFEFDVTFTEKKKTFDFRKVSEYLYATSGRIIRLDTTTDTITVVNATYKVKTLIYPEVLSTQEEAINLWVIIGSSVGGILLLIVVSVGLWKIGFFKRKKKDDLSRWKRQSGFYASRQTQLLEHVPRQSVITSARPHNSYNF